MRKHKWLRLHRWIGLPLCLILALFALSGIVLNHRTWWASCEVSRAVLPSAFSYRQWNQGLLRGTLRQGQQLLLYGSGGIFRADTLGQHLQDYNQGLPQGADYRQVRAVVSHDQRLYMATLMGVYSRKPKGTWTAEEVGVGERFSDLIVVRDTLYAVSRSHIYVKAHTDAWTQMELPRALDDDGRVSLFRVLWLLHSGELLGLGGQLLVDAIGLLLLALSGTGLLHFLFPKVLRRIKQPRWRKRIGMELRRNVVWHERIGRTAFVLLLFVIATGWLLRPPLLIAIVRAKVPVPPLTTLDSDNPWHDRLRMLRYDEVENEWLLSTSTGFYAFEHWGDALVPLAHAPHVSPMGLNVWTRSPQGEWLIGSFSGLYAWRRSTGEICDAFSGRPIAEISSIPFGRVAVSGHSSDLHPPGQPHQPIITTHDGGTPHLPQPEWLTHLPMSLWNVALEVHTGRFYTFLPTPDAWWVFFCGLLSLVLLVSGWKMRRKRKVSG